MTDSSAPTLRGLDMEAHLSTPAIRQRYVTTMFEMIAPKYDRFTRAFSFGMDVAWKNELLAQLRPTLRTDARVLDLACGTGDLAAALARLVPDGRVHGVDAAPTMISCAKERGLGITNLRFAVGDMMCLDVPDASQDVVTIGYGLRNVPDHRVALREIHRVLKPGGTLANLDFALPEPGAWRWLFLRYLKTMGDVYGWLWHGEPEVYGYISRSIAHFVTLKQLAADMTATGFTVSYESPKLNGGVCLHVARKN
jgi:ubiquinone/menaquinone biosynthesis methyltransferase